MRPEKIDHLGIAVRSVEKALPFYQGPLGLQVIHEEVISDQKVRAVFLQVGESTIELLEPTSSDSPIAKFIEKRGEGIHHIAYAVADIRAKLREAKEAGIRLIDEEPRPGGHGKLIAFLHPKDTNGVLTEYCQRVHGE
jgi:methylmalonyl-CoA/ethylmalonyl-CoA epimerase